MKLKAIAAIALTAVTLPLAASAQGAGHEQLARALGVDGANYTTAQLAKAAGYLSDDSSPARQQIAFILMRSTTPSKFSSAPMGNCSGTGLPFRRSLIWPTLARPNHHL